MIASLWRKLGGGSVSALAGGRLPPSLPAGGSRPQSAIAQKARGGAMEAMTRREWKRAKRRIWWRKNEDKVIGGAMAPVALAMMGFVIKVSGVLEAGKLFEILLQAVIVFVLAMLCVGTIAAIIKLWVNNDGKSDL